jgi:hypothetical protein
MKEDKPLAEDLRFVIGLDSQSLSGVDRSETLLQFAQDICVHGITSSKISAAFHQIVRLCQTLQSFTFGQRPGFTDQHDSFACRGIQGGRCPETSIKA